MEQVEFNAAWFEALLNAEFVVAHVAHTALADGEFLIARALNESRVNVYSDACFELSRCVETMDSGEYREHQKRLNAVASDICAFRHSVSVRRSSDSGK